MSNVQYPAVSIQEVSKACRQGNLRLLQTWDQSGQLPNLMTKDAARWYPHERAAANGQIEVLKWLVHESGQPIELRSDQNFAFRQAAINGYKEAAKWLLTDSGQKINAAAVQNDAFNTGIRRNHFDLCRWLLFDSGQLLKILRAPIAFTDWPTERESDLRQYVSIRQATLRSLKPHAMSKPKLERILASDACCQAVQAQLVTSVTDLDKLLATTRKSPKRCRL